MFQVMFGIEDVHSSEGKIIQKQRVRLGKAESNCVIIHLLYLCWLPTDGQPFGEGGGEFFIEEHVLIPENYVISGKRMSI